MKRILHFSLTKSIGGIESFQRNLYNHTDKDEFEMEFTTSCKNSAAVEAFRKLGAVVHELPSQKNPIAYCRALYKLLKSGNYDIVHVHKNSLANPMAIFVSKYAGIKKIVVHAHNTAAVGGRGVHIFHYMFRPLVKKCADVKLACSKDAGKWIFGKDKSFVMIKNGIDTQRFSFDEKIRNQTRHELQLENKLVIGHVGNYIPQKNHRFMVDIMCEAVKLNKNSVMLFVGNGSAMVDIAQYISQKGMKDNIRLLGARSDVHRLYSAMDVFLFPSLHEGLPIAGVEAQTSSLPCLFSDAVTKEIMLCDNAYTMSLEDTPKAWAKRVLELGEGDVRSDMSQVVRKNGYDIKSTCEAVQKLYG